jgi:hypothetical protein
MYCTRYKCEMPEKTCVIRQRRHIGHMPVSGVSRDPGCLDCAQGREVMTAYKAKEKEMEKNAQQAKSTERESVPEKIAVEVKKTCSKCKTDFFGTDAIDLRFYASKNTPDGYEAACKACKTERARVLRAKKRVAAKGGPVTKKKVKKKTPGRALPDQPETKTVIGVSLGRTPGKINTIKKNYHPMDLDEMVKTIFEKAGHAELYKSLFQAAFIDMRPPHLEMIFLAMCQLRERGIEK